MNILLTVKLLSECYPSLCHTEVVKEVSLSCFEEDNSFFKVEDASSFLDQVKLQFRNQPTIQSNLNFYTKLPVTVCFDRLLIHIHSMLGKL